MNREQYDNSNITEQLNYINNKLKEDYTITSICKEIKIGRTTVTDRFKIEGYKFSKPLKQFIKDAEYKHNTDILQVTTTNVIAKNEYKRNTNIFNNKNAQTKILDIIEKHDDIEEMLQWYHDQKNVIEVDLNELKIDSDKLVGDVKVTTVRLYSEVWESFRGFMEDNKQFKSMDLISMSMVEYMEKYSKIT